MKHLKRFIATLAITVLPFHSYVNGCGGDFYDYMNYYNLFDQLLLENKGLQPFLLTTDDAFYGEDMDPDGKQQQPDENINAWMTFFKKNKTLQDMNEEQFKALLYTASYQSLKQPSSPYITALNKTDAGKHTLTYLQYAKELEPYAQLSNNGDWWEMKRTSSPSEETYTHYKETGMVTFSWDAATDDVTPSRALQYNIYVKKAGSKEYFMTVPADLQTGFIKTGEISGQIMTTSYSMYIDNEDTEYEWGVQAIDNGKRGGHFALSSFNPAATGTQENKLSEVCVYTANGDIHYNVSENTIIEIINTSGISIVRASVNGSGVYRDLEKGVYLVSTLIGKLSRTFKLAL